MTRKKEEQERKEKWKENEKEKEKGKVCHFPNSIYYVSEIDVSGSIAESILCLFLVLSNESSKRRVRH